MNNNRGLCVCVSERDRERERDFKCGVKREKKMKAIRVSWRYLTRFL